MNPKVEPATIKQRGVLRRLRPPSAQALLLSVPFKHEGNPGNTYRLQSGEPAVCPGDGVLERIRHVAGRWQHAPGALDQSITYEVVIDHGQGIKTLLHGLSNVSASLGTPVTRGQKIGDLFDTELFFQLFFHGSVHDPVTINRHFVPQDGTRVVGRGGYLKHAPDLLDRTFAENTASVIYGNVRYVVDLLCGKPPVLLNIDFNGSGLKTGLAATGISGDDHWNVIAPTDFTTTPVTYSCNKPDGSANVTYSPNPHVPLYDYAGKRSIAWLWRVASSNVYGSDSLFDAMLGSYVGGYAGITPIRTSFGVNSLPAGTYEIYLYANKGTPPLSTKFYVSVNGSTPVLKTNSPTATEAFIEGANYVKYTIVIPANGYMLMSAYGYFSGAQIIRI